MATARVGSLAHAWAVCRQLDAEAERTRQAELDRAEARLRPTTEQSDRMRAERMRGA